LQYNSIIRNTTNVIFIKPALHDLHWLDALQRQLKVMASTAFSLCMDNKMPIIAVDFPKLHNLKRLILGEKVGCA